MRPSTVITGEQDRHNTNRRFQVRGERGQDGAKSQLGDRLISSHKLHQGKYYTYPWAMMPSLIGHSGQLQDIVIITLQKFDRALRPLDSSRRLPSRAQHQRAPSCFQNRSQSSQARPHAMGNRRMERVSPDTDCARVAQRCG